MNLDLRYKGATRSMDVNNARSGSSSNVSDVIDRYTGVSINDCDLEEDTIS